MNLLELDFYSLGSIINKLDMNSYKSIRLTCKKLLEISKKHKNSHIWKWELQNELINIILNGSNRDDVPASMKFQYDLQLFLRFFLHGVTYIEYFQHLMTGCNKPHLDIPFDLLLMAAASNDSVALTNLTEIGYKIGMKITCWFSFRIDENTLMYLCKVKHPEDYLKQPSKDPIIAIVHRSKLNLTKAYCYNLSSHDLSYLDFRDVVCSGHESIFESPCTELKSIFPRSIFPITPTELIKLGEYDLLKHVSELECMRNTKDTEYDNLTLTPDHKQEDVIDSIKKAWGRSALLFFREDMKRFATLLVTYYQLTDFMEINFINKLIDSVTPFFKVTTVFGYGELLAYLPLVVTLLHRVDIQNRVLTDQTESLRLLLSPEKVIVVMVFHAKQRVEVHFQMTDCFDFTWYAGCNFSVEQEAELQNLLNVFDKFVEETFLTDELASVPLMSFRVILKFTMLLFLRTTFDEIDLKV